MAVTFEFLYDRPGFLYSHKFFVVNIKVGWGREKKMMEQYKSFTASQTFKLIPLAQDEIDN